MKAHEDPSLQVAYFQPLDDFLSAQGAPVGFGRDRPQCAQVEAAYVADRFRWPRGWERQLDLKYNQLFYSGILTADAYRGWPDEASVRYVAVPDAGRLCRDRGGSADLVGPLLSQAGLEQ